MSKAEKFIRENTRNKVNHITENFPWVPVVDARKAVEIAREEVLDAIEKELTRRMLEDYNLGVEEDEIKRDEIAQGCMASLIMFVRQMKEE
jgi:hypothetical protein